MARIEGIDLPRSKRIEIGLQYIYGIGPARAKEILAATKVNPDIRVNDLTEADVSALRDYISKTFKVEGDLRRDVQMNIKRLVEIGCYRGLRHRRSLPVHGQRTRTNSRTRKGPKRTVAGRGRRRGATKK
ncbi:MAG: 30S ribosomal protein S13 [Anaerolineae bacterium]|jgi:small subunit ribosomal protein S13|nr:30S ribosomal protein S13 [Anaerolineae bacterium]